MTSWTMFTTPKQDYKSFITSLAAAERSRDLRIIILLAALISIMKVNE